MSVLGEVTPAQGDTRPRLLHYLVLFAVSLFVTLPGIVQLPPVDRDEARFVQASKQMVESGDFVDIRFQDEHRYKKPVGIYWLQAAAVELSGRGAAAPIWVYRIVSVLGILIAVVATYWTSARLFGTRAALISALVMAAIFGSAFEGRIAKTDAILLGLCIMAQGALAQIYVTMRRQEAQPRSLPWIFWIAQGLAILIKGPIAPLLSALTILTLVVADRKWRWLGALRPLLGIGVVALIVLPWIGLITAKTGMAFFQESIGKDLGGKLAQGSESHWGPPGYYVLTYSLYFWPFGLMAIAAGLAGLRSFTANPAVRFCIAWYIPFWLLLELVSTKLPHYVLPAYPGMILLIGWAATQAPLSGALRTAWWEKAFWYATALGLLVVTLGLAGLAIGAPIYLEGHVSWWSLPTAALILVAGWLAFSPRLDLPTGRVAGAALAAAGAYALMFALILPSLDAMWLSRRVVEAVETMRPCPTSVLASARFHEPSLVFLAGTATVLTDAAGAAAHLNANTACALALVPAEDDAAFKAALGAGPAPVALTAIDGLNYSSGDHLSMTLYRVAP
jgi:4-amino-4-deoxy-L-arabinose transferase-like glycosyltransferase